MEHFLKNLRLHRNGLHDDLAFFPKAYLNLTSTYTIHLARDTGMRRRSYRIGVICSKIPLFPGEFHINYMLREFHYNECLTTKNSLHCGILDSTSSAWSISTDVPTSHCNHIGTLDAIASPAAPTKTLSRLINWKLLTRPRARCQRHYAILSPPDSQVHALMVGASNHVIRAVIHGNHWHLSASVCHHRCVSPRFDQSTSIAPWHPHNQASHDGNGPWYSTVVLVRKKDGSSRFCINYRELNEVTWKDAQPLPRIDATFVALAGTKCFTTLDLASGY
ncbi:Transposon Ty3-I Gag-Pol polyprotein [Trichinella nelsoni]|uniref:Transposon Ty3-I Gag-Pol polyprotein n=1 Tax=Trichinella nelsoni TaxID=6336 RepID=A0A0V0SFG4_9BILA|nr:Transposon Ty3-I Gag-Pol polyprotein [Trichinella nelsoni]